MCAVRPIDPAPAGKSRLKQVLGARALIAIGLGATIGSGIFVLTGTVAANQSGPAITLSLLIAAFGGGLAALCYSEFAAFLPIPGSAYSYTYATLGEALAWFIGWNLLLEYAISASAVAVSWSAYVVSLLDDAHIHLPPVTGQRAARAGRARARPAHRRPHQRAGRADHRGDDRAAVRRRARLGGRQLLHGDPEGRHHRDRRDRGSQVCRYFQLAAVRAAEQRQWWHFGWSGVLQGAAIIFFSYVGFDTASTTALEARNPQRDLPIGILGALLISAVLYVAMATVLTGMVPFQKLDSDAPVAVALDAHPQLAWLSWLVKVGVIAGMTSVILTSLLGQPRILLSMADDGLLPPAMSRCHPRFKTPHVATVMTGIFAALIAAVFPLDLLADLISMGILLAFAVVCAGVLVLRYTRPNEHRPFRVPWAPVTCVVGTLYCLALTLPVARTGSGW